MRAFIAGFLAAVLGAAYVPQLHYLLWACSLLAAAMLCERCCGARTRRLLLGMIVGLAVAWWHGNALLQARVAPACTGQSITVSGSIASLPSAKLTYRGDTRQTVRLDVADVVPVHCRGIRSVYLSYYGDQTLLPGEAWSFSARLKRPWGSANPGSPGFQAWYAEQGIDAVGSSSVAWPTSAAVSRSGALAGINTHRHRISSALQQMHFAPSVSAVLRALVVADKDGIENSLWRLFRDLGISHLLVISGLHVGLVGGLGVLLGTAAARLFRSSTAWVQWLPALFGLVPALVYSAFAGFSLPTQRATIMLGVFLLCTALGRPASGEQRLLWAACVVLVVNPLAGIGSGFWLSFGAVLALLWLARWQRPAIPLWRRLVGTHVFMSLAMLPLSAWFFDGASVVAALANLIFIPVIGFTVVPPALLGAVAFLCGLPGYQSLWQLASLPLQVLLPISRAALEAAPGAVFLPLDVSFMTACLAVCAVTLVVLPRAAQARPYVMLFLLAAVMRTNGETAVQDSTPQLTVLDVGQGTSVVLRAQGKTLVYDTGGGDPVGRNAASEVLIPYLKAEGVQSIDTLVISHGDLDHSAGLQTLLSQFTVQRLRYGTGVATGTGGRPCRAGQSWRWTQSVQFMFLSPGTRAGDSTNNGSCVLQIALGDYRLLLAGDIDKRREREIAIYWRHELQSEWLLVPHHGSGTSSSHVLLKAVQPSISVVSASYGNPFGHPRADVLARLGLYGSAIFNTAAAGALTFEFDAAGLAAVRRFRGQGLPYWM
ncbi:MAG: DNA internalization-related competence protein ComEC/Rec2 [Gammaproteobacteria bacterium]|nr:DNA internalization-related competence protein ComEC/Rec2 [Gammaproteobacteria bacterium]